MRGLDLEYGYPEMCLTLHKVKHAVSLTASDNSRGRYDGFEVVGLLLSSLVIVALIT